MFFKTNKFWTNTIYFLNIVIFTYITLRILFYLCLIYLSNALKSLKLLTHMMPSSRLIGSVTRLGDILDFGQLFKAFATINLPKSATFLSIFCKGIKIFNISSEIIFGQILQTFGDFFWSHCPYGECSLHSFIIPLLPK